MIKPKLNVLLLLISKTISKTTVSWLALIVEVPETSRITLCRSLYFRGGNKIEKKLFFLYVFQLHFILHELGNIE